MSGCNRRRVYRPRKGAQAGMFSTSKIETNVSTPNTPLSSEFGTNQPVKTSFWPWFEPFSVRKSGETNVIETNVSVLLKSNAHHRLGGATGYILGRGNSYAGALSTSHIETNVSTPLCLLSHFDGCVFAVALMPIGGLRRFRSPIILRLM